MTAKQAKALLDRLGFRVRFHQCLHHWMLTSTERGRLAALVVGPFTSLSEAVAWAKGVA